MGQALRILCVEDDEDTRTIITLSLLLDASIDVREASNGTEALEILRGHWRPDCVLLDSRMPFMNGEDLVHRIRKMPGLEGIPVIFLTASLQPRELARYQELGAHGIISKPFDPLTLVDMVRASLSNRAFRLV